MMFKYLGDMGYTGSLPDRLYAWLVATDRINISLDEWVSQLDSNELLTNITDLYNGFVPTDSTFSGGPTIVKNYLDTLITVPAGTRAIEGGDLSGTTWSPTNLTPQHLIPTRKGTIAKYEPDCNDEYFCKQWDNICCFRSIWLYFSIWIIWYLHQWKTL
jgi:hypothetical protein